MFTRDWTPAFRRYQGRASVAMGCYVLLIVGVAWLFANRAPTGVLAYAAAILPAIPLICVIVSMGLYLKEETDEFRRYQVVRQMLIGTGGTLVVASVYGFLESFVKVHHFEAYWIVVLWFFMFGVARCVVRWGQR